ncbi:MAG: hypothetical protein ACP5IJ_02465 [Candidatus Nanoarchaeia archaeon]
MNGYLGLLKILKKKKKIFKRVNFKEIEKFLVPKWYVKIPKEIEK